MGYYTFVGKMNLEAEWTIKSKGIPKDMEKSNFFEVMREAQVFENTTTRLDVVYDKYKNTYSFADDDTLVKDINTEVLLISNDIGVSVFFLRLDNITKNGRMVFDEAVMKVEVESLEKELRR